MTVHRDKFRTIKQPDAPISQIYFGLKLYMFRTVRTVHHQDFFTVHTTKGICHIGLLTACEQTPDDGQTNCPKHVEFKFKINLRNWCIWLFYYKKLATCYSLNAA
jgi:hypothetical protein